MFLRLRLVAKIMERWKSSTVERQREKFLAKTADLHYMSGLLPKYLELWKDRTQFKVWKSQIAEQSTAFYRCVTSHYSLQNLFFSLISIV